MDTRRTLRVLPKIFCIALLTCAVLPAYGFQLPDTDLQTCYELADTGIGVVIPCGGTGQDGAYRNGPLSYTDNGNGTVTDANTDLVWQQGEPGTMGWDAATTYCDALDLGGQTDWRLPSRKELLRLLEIAPFDPFSIPDPMYNLTFFPNAVVNDYWTSTERAGNATQAWYVKNLKSESESKSSNQPNVRCVRGAVNDAAAFTDNGNGTVTDGRTTLVWQQGNPAARAQGDATTYCEGLELNGLTDWRLPNVKELETLVDLTLVSPTIDTAFFPGTTAMRYWSSTPFTYVEFDGGYVDGYLPSSIYGVRCVRGGPTGPFAVDDLTRDQVGFPVQIHPLNNDLAPAGGALAVTGVTQGANGGVSTDGTTATYTPNAAFEGFDWFTYTIGDGLGGSDTATVTVKVTSTPDNPPVAVDDTGTTNMVQQVSIAVLSNDTDLDGDPLTVSEVTQGANGAVTTDGTNAFYTPNADFFGSDSFTYTADDGFGGTDIGTVTVTINQNYAPVTVGDAVTTRINVPVVIAVLANDTDADGNTLTITGLDDVDHGTVTTDGTMVTYTPDPGFTGSDAFRYTVIDGAGGTAWAMVTVTVTMAANFRSVGSQDGWVLESSETSNVGGSLNAIATTIDVGDDAVKRQYRGILSFNTAALPDDAVITSVTLKVRRQSASAVNPFSALGGLLVDVRKGAFSNNSALQTADFRTAASKAGVATIPSKLAGGWYSAVLKPAAFQYINQAGVTQFRLRFTKDDNNNGIATFLRIFSGNAVAASRPLLIVNYIPVAP